jgi:hypothetical protein
MRVIFSGKGNLCNVLVTTRGLKCGNHNYLIDLPFDSIRYVVMNNTLINSNVRHLKDITRNLIYVHKSTLYIYNIKKDGYMQIYTCDGTNVEVNTSLINVGKFSKSFVFDNKTIITYSDKDVFIIKSGSVFKKFPNTKLFINNGKVKAMYNGLVLYNNDKLTLYRIHDDTILFNMSHGFNGNHIDLSYYRRFIHMFKMMKSSDNPTEFKKNIN